VSGNVINNPSEAGLRFIDDDDLNATNNQVNNNGAVGIHYASGIGGSLQFNTVTRTGSAPRCNSARIPRCRQTVGRSR
jgi:parallel beta-helix repeat protein